MQMCDPIARPGLRQRRDGGLEGMACASRDCSSPARDNWSLRRRQVNLVLLPW